MARQPKITRTFKVTHITILAIDLDSAEPYNDTITITKCPKDEKAIMKRIEKAYNDEHKKAVKIVDTKTEMLLYAMTEEKFIETAEVIEKR